MRENKTESSPATESSAAQVSLAHEEQALTDPQRLPHQNRAEYILHLQRTHGNRAVQRMLANQERPIQRLAEMPHALRERGGAPKNDIDLGSLTIKSMSSTYKRILSNLGDYRHRLRLAVISADPQVRREQAKHILESLLQAKFATQSYIFDHRDTIPKLRQKLTKTGLFAPREASRESIKQEIDRFEAIEQLNTDLNADEKTIEGIAERGESINEPWLDAMIARSTTPLPASPDLTGDPDVGQRSDNVRFADPEFAQANSGLVGFGAAGVGNAQDTSKPMYDNVTAVATKSNPLVVGVGGGIPAPANIYTTVPLTEGRGRKHQVLYDENNPRTEYNLAPNSLFIGGAPHTEDIKQGSLGDCYFLAAVNNIIRTDPNKIPAMMNQNGPNIEVTFKRFDHAAGSYLNQKVTVPQTLLQGTGMGNPLIGAGFRIDPTPATSHYYLADLGLRPTFQGHVVVRKDIHVGALWVPLLEKAYMRFMQTYERHGEPEFNQGKAASAYDRVAEGGDFAKAMNIFYGNEAMREETPRMAYEPTANPTENAQQNAPLIKFLTKIQGATITEKGITKTVHIGATIGQRDQAQRALKTIQAVQGNEGVTHQIQQALGHDFGAFMDQLTKLAGLLEENMSIFGDATREKTQPITTVAQQIAKPDAPWGNYLHGNTTAVRSPLIQTLLEAIVNATAIGGDTSEGQRNIYSRHAYDVVGVVFKDNIGTVIPNVTGANINSVDIQKSTVTLFNPHGKNTPDLTGQQEEGANGQFDLTIERFIQNFASVQALSTKG